METGEKIIGRNNNKTDTIDSLRIDNILKYDPDSITKGFCDFFSNIGETYAKNIEKSEVDIDEYIGEIDPNPHSLFSLLQADMKLKNRLINYP